MSACIIPAGPEFQDPAGVPDSPPFLWSASPDEGTTVVSPTPTFIVTPGDYNIGDPIYVKWITEFPPYFPGGAGGGTVDLGQIEISPSADGSPIRGPSQFKPNCTLVNSSSPTHHITAAISDSPFTGQQQDLIKTMSTVPPRLVIWTWAMNCQATPGTR